MTLGSEIVDLSLMSAPSQGSVPWQEQTLTFVATAVTEVLSFMAVGDGGSTVNLPPIALLDGIDLEVAEPGGLSLTCIGVLGLAAIARRRHVRGAAAA